MRVFDQSHRVDEPMDGLRCEWPTKSNPSGRNKARNRRRFRPPVWRLRTIWCYGVFLVALVTQPGCIRLQEAVPVLAPYVVGQMACPSCGLLSAQGCCCHPDHWNYGYHPTRWRSMHVELVNTNSVDNTLPPPELTSNGESAASVPRAQLSPSPTEPPPEYYGAPRSHADAERPGGAPEPDVAPPGELRMEPPAPIVPADSSAIPIRKASAPKVRILGELRDANTGRVRLTEFQTPVRGGPGNRLQRLPPISQTR
jgi:hypothetical protein